MKLLKRLFVDYYWVVAYKKKDETSYHPIKCKKNYWAADPFLFEYNNEIYAFFEYTNTKKNKSVIGYSNISSNPDDIKVAFEFPGHTSYPCIFEHNGTIYMIPETCYCNAICLLKCNAFPSNWEKQAVLMKNIHAVDTTIYKKNSEIFCFVYSFNPDLYNERKLFFGRIDFNSFILKDFKNIIEYANKDGRPGGNCFRYNDMDIRVVQPSHNFYGEKIVFYSFDFGDGDYFEKQVSEILPQDIRVTGLKKINGIHTYNALGEYQIIDVRVNCIDLFKPFKRLFRLIGLFGYSDYERKNKFLFNGFENKQ